MKRHFFVAILISVALNIVIVSAYFYFTTDVNPIDQVLRRNRINATERAWLEEKGALVYGADRNSPPLRYVDPYTGQYIGLVVDYVNALSIELGIEIKMEPEVWGTALDKLSTGETDFGDMFPSRERAERYLFTDGFYTMRGIIVVRDDDDSISTVADLAVKTVAVPRGDFAIDFLRSKNPDQRFIFTEDNNNALNMVKIGRADAVIGDEPVLSYFLKSIDDSESLKILASPAYEMACVLAVPKSEKMLVGILNKGIRSLHEKEMMLKIQQKWLGVTATFVQPRGPEKAIVLLAGIANILLLGLYIFSRWNQGLKREVAVRTAELHQSRNELQITFDGLSHFLIVFDAGCHVTNANKAFNTFLGKPKETLLNRHCLSVGLPYTTNCATCLVAKTLIDGCSHHEELSRKEFVYELSTYPSDFRGKDVASVVLMIRDVTTERITEEKIRLNNKMAAVGQLAAGMAHEIRNPLGLIRNSGYILRRSIARQNGNVDKNLELIETSVEKASHIIDNMLSFSRIDAAEFDNTHIREAINEILNLERKLMNENKIEAEIECDEHLYCPVNREMLKQVLINLIMNAIDAMPDGGVLQITAAETDRNLTVICRDSGKGIDPDHLSDIFNPFFTTKPKGKGTGLGLYIAYNDVKRCGGEIGVTSSPGIGTTFTITLPTDRARMKKTTH